MSLYVSVLKFSSGNFTVPLTMLVLLLHQLFNAGAVALILPVLDVAQGML